VTPPTTPPEGPLDRPLLVMATAPLVVGVAVEDPSQGAAAAAQLAAEHAGVAFVGVVAAGDDDQLDAVLVTLAPHLAEVVFTAPPGERGMDADVAALAALERYGFGQDFVFQVPKLTDAVRYVVDALTGELDFRWEGTAVLVAGTPGAVEAAALAIVDEGRADG
jgi:folylpolyglutamate synthase/dihydropteroate synthase